MRHMTPVVPAALQWTFKISMVPADHVVPVS